MTKPNVQRSTLNAQHSAQTLSVGRWAWNVGCCDRGLTLIETLVVIGIIALLLIVLVPMMGHAIYQAELAQCGTKLKTIAGGVTTYALANDRFYPDRAGMPYAALLNFGEMWDPRPTVARAFALDPTLNCPLTKSIAITPPGTESNTAVIPPYMLWFAFGYQGERGLFKLGDALTFGGRSFGTIAGDHDWRHDFGDRGADHATHPDQDGKLVAVAFENNGTGRFKWSYSGWDLGWKDSAGRRGPLDTNHAFCDGSVVRYNDVRPAKTARSAGDERMALVSRDSDPQHEPAARNQIPTR